MKAAVEEIKAQEGPQQRFLECDADIVFYGGAAGGAKTFGLLLDPLRWLTHKKVTGFNGVIFRRESPQITNGGGLWDESDNIYPKAGCIPVMSRLTWLGPGGRKNKLKFSHLQLESDVHAHQGAQYAFIGFDELTHFSRKQFFYMLSRLRSTCGVRPYMRGTMNPDPDSWVRKFIDWWIGEDGLPIPERSGVIRWFAMHRGEVVWADDKDTLVALGLKPKSFTFIPASIFDNKKLLEKDSDYLSNLEALPLVERERLLGGNWNIRPVAGMVFKREWFPIVDAAPAGGSVIRYWDRAATEESAQAKDPDYTAGVRMRYVGGKFYIEDVRRFRASPHKVQSAMRATADQDGADVEVCMEGDPGQAGKVEVAMLAPQYADRVFYTNFVKDDKYVRAKPMSAQAEQGNVILVRGPWNQAFLDEMESFADWKSIPREDRPKPEPHDDQVDAASGAYNQLVKRKVPRVRII